MGKRLTRNNSKFRYGTLVLLSTLAVFCGCDSSPKIDESANNPTFSYVGGIAEVYSKYQAVIGGTPDQAKLTQFGNDRGGYTLKRLGVDKFEDLLTSQRDSQPIVLLLGKSKLVHEGNRIIAHEMNGVDGNRMVALDHGGAELLTEEQFEAAKKKK